MNEIGTLNSSAPEPLLRVFQNNGRWIVTVDRDGNVKLADGVTVDEASRVFWEALATYNPLLAEVEKLRLEVALLKGKL